jgi:hypothetical protein
MSLDLPPLCCRSVVILKLLVHKGRRLGSADGDHLDADVQARPRPVGGHRGCVQALRERETGAVGERETRPPCRRPEARRTGRVRRGEVDRPDASRFALGVAPPLVEQLVDETPQRRAARLEHDAGALDASEHYRL